MAKISEVEIPSLLFNEQGSAPATPSSGLWKIYFKSDGVYVIDDAGAETGPLGSGSGGGSAPVAKAARVETSESTTSGSFTDLATSGPAVTVTVPASGVLMVTVGAKLSQSSSSSGAAMAFALSGANTVAAADGYSVAIWNPAADGFDRLGRTFVLTGLSAGSTTITAKYRRLNTGTATFAEREISAVAGFAAS